MLESAESEHAVLTTVKLFSKNSNLYDHMITIAQRHGETDRQTT